MSGTTGSTLRPNIPKNVHGLDNHDWVRWSDVTLSRPFPQSCTTDEFSNRCDYRYNYVLCLGLYNIQVWYLDVRYLSSASEPFGQTFWLHWDHGWRLSTLFLLCFTTQISVLSVILEFLGTIGITTTRKGIRSPKKPCFRSLCRIPKPRVPVNNVLRFQDVPRTPSVKTTCFGWVKSGESCHIHRSPIRCNRSL